LRFNGAFQTVRHLNATFVIAGGYTAGHLTPGLAVAEELRERYPQLRLLFAGRADPAEAEFVRHSGLSFLPLPAAPWACQSALARGRSLGVMLPAVWIARRKFRSVGAVGLLSLGSFAVFAPALAARSLGLPLTVFEPNAKLGLANGMLRPLARQVLASKLFAAGTRPSPARCEIVGVPLRSSLQALAGRKPSPPAGEIRLLVLGGSLGSPFLNAQAPGLARQLASLGLTLRVTHQCGREADPAAVRVAYAQTGVRAVVEPFFDPFAPVLADADFILTAAGAITLHEIAAAGVPMLITPLRAGAGAHQYANAEAFARANGSLVRTEETWEEVGIAKAIAAVVGDPTLWQTQSRALQIFVAGNARAAIVDQIVAMLPARALRT
jgi:UDP-N-acetylglucosamine--N-acetylmuramyl-(pentapeptide) pyrophosphoryl-undecaprenol N-acetylglucosamine transferase